MTAIAVDGQRLANQNPADVADYGGPGGDATRWAQDHNRAIGFTTNPDERFNTRNGSRTATEIGNELQRAGYTGPWNRDAMIQTYASWSGGAVTPVSAVQPVPQPLPKTNPATQPNPDPDKNKQPDPSAIKIQGDPWQWFRQQTLISGVPNGAVVGGLAGLYVVLTGKRGRLL